jgi:hypothetical protein
MNAARKAIPIPRVDAGEGAEPLPTLGRRRARPVAPVADERARHAHVRADQVAAHVEPRERDRSDAATSKHSEKSTPGMSDALRKFAREHSYGHALLRLHVDAKRGGCAQVARESELPRSTVHALYGGHGHDLRARTMWKLREHAGIPLEAWFVVDGGGLLVAMNMSSQLDRP